MSGVAAPNAILFHKDDVIVEYDGELIDVDTLKKRYDLSTAPYGVGITRTQFEDGACIRGVGSMANHNASRASNARFSISRTKGKSRIILKATKAIRNGDEVLINYGRDYKWDEGTHHSTRRVR